MKENSKALLSIFPAFYSVYNYNEISKNFYAFTENFKIKNCI